MKSLIASLAMTLAILTGPASAEQQKSYTTYTKQGEFAEVFQDLEDAIINRGYVVDYVGHLDTMLERTSETVGSVTEEGKKSPYVNAKYMHFCSAKLSHEAVSANPFNIAICPYVLFAFETHNEKGRIVVGYRHPFPGPSKRTKAAFTKVEALLDEISREATDQ